MNSDGIGFQVEGGPGAERKLGPSSALFAAYATLDPRIAPDAEAFLNLFDYPRDILAHVKKHGSIKGYRGSCGGTFAWVDIDRRNLEEALTCAKRLVLHLTDNLDADSASLPVFFSGSKGFHIGIPLHWRPPMGSDFPARCRGFVECIANQAGVAVDLGIYDPVRIFRAPNSRHSKTGLFKRWLAADGFERIGMPRVLELACSPEPFEVPDIGVAECPKLREIWESARPAVVQLRSSPMFVSQNTMAGHLDRDTIEFIREGATVGERANRLFRASANLAEFQRKHGIEQLAFEILKQSASECGLPPSEVRHNFRSGWCRGCGKGVAG